MEKWIKPHLVNLNKRVHGNKLWASLDFSLNVNPLGPPEFVTEVINKAKFLTSYPEENSLRLKKLIAEYHHVQQENILVGNGVNELLFLLPQVLEIKKAWIVHPTFAEYEAGLRANNLHVAYFFYEEENKEFKLPCDEFGKQISQGDMLYICRPNNPTGHLIPLTVMLNLIELAEKRQFFLIIDESFSEFTTEKGLISYFNNKRPLIILRSLTKIYNIPGIRLGYGLIPSELAERIERVRDPWSVNRLAQVIGEQIFSEQLKRDSFLQETKEWLSEEKNWLWRELEKIGWEVYPSQTNFFLIKTSINSEIWYEELKKEGIAVRLPTFPNLDHRYLRLVVRKREENLTLLNAIKQIKERLSI